MKDKIKPTGGSSGPSSLSAGSLPGSLRRASEGGANLYMKTKGEDGAAEGAPKINEI